MTGRQRRLAARARPIALVDGDGVDHTGRTQPLVARARAEAGNLPVLIPAKRLGRRNLAKLTPRQALTVRLFGDRRVGDGGVGA